MDFLLVIYDLLTNNHKDFARYLYLQYCFLTMDEYSTLQEVKDSVESDAVTELNKKMFGLLCRGITGNLFLVLLLLLPPQLVHTQERSTFDYDLNGQRVTYYPESLMLPRNPRAIVFYQDTKLLNMFVDLRTPEIGHDFPINNTCYSEFHFLSQLLQ